MTAVKRILVAVDGSESAECAVLEAVFWAGCCGAELDFVYVANLNGAIGAYPQAARGGIPQSILESVVEIGRAVLEHTLDQVPASIRGKGHCVNGSPGPAIAKAAEDLGADMIVIGSRGLGVIKGAILGSVSRFLVENAKCPVMVVKVEHFVRN